MSSAQTSDAIHKATEKATRQVTFKARGRAPINRQGGNENNTRWTRDMVAEQYPSKGYSLEDPRDAKYELMTELQKGADAPGSTPYGQIAWSDDVVKWMEKKKQVGLKAQFEEWFAQEFDKFGPTEKALAQQLYPNFYRERVATLKLNVKLLEQLATIKLTGVQSKSDLFLKYAADNGMIDMTTIDSILHPESTQELANAKFKRGLWNPRRLVNGDNGYPGDTSPDTLASRFNLKTTGTVPGKTWPNKLNRADMSSYGYLNWLKTQ